MRRNLSGRNRRLQRRRHDLLRRLSDRTNALPRRCYLRINTVAGESTRVVRFCRSPWETKPGGFPTSGSGITISATIARSWRSVTSDDYSATSGLQPPASPCDSTCSLRKTASRSGRSLPLHLDPALLRPPCRHRPPGAFGGFRFISLSRSRSGLPRWESNKPPLLPERFSGGKGGSKIIRLLFCRE